jgi:TfoX/Sxy family transcriptional regulator of competence genes
MSRAKGTKEDREKLTASIRSALAETGAVREARMFGGIGFMLNGNLLLGASQRGLLVRVGKEGEQEALSRRGARPMVMGGRRMGGYVYVDREALNECAVRQWVQLAVSFVATLPPKLPGSKPKRAKAKQSS